MEGAAKNMAAEAPHNDFDQYLAETKDNWNRQLGKIEVTGDNKDDKVNFYTEMCIRDRYSPRFCFLRESP